MAEIDIMYPRKGNSLGGGKWHVYARPFAEYLNDADRLDEPKLHEAINRLKSLPKPVHARLMCAP